MPDRANARWSPDFLSDKISDSRRFTVLAIVDGYTRECLALVAYTSLSGLRVSPSASIAGRTPLSTGRSGTYRYLTCANKANEGELSCRGQSVRMDAIDEIVLSAMEAEVLTPLRLKCLMGQAIDAANAGLERFHRATEKGFVDILGKAFAQRIADVKLRIESEERIRDLKNRRVLHSTRISDEHVAVFSQQVCERLCSGNPAFRRACLLLFVDRVVIGPDGIRIFAPKQALAEGLVQENVKAGTMVSSFDRKWRARKDSNL